MVYIQGALKVAYFSYVGFNATQKTGQKTSKIVQVIEFTILNCPEVVNGCLQVMCRGLEFLKSKGINEEESGGYILLKKFHRHVTRRATGVRYKNIYNLYKKVEPVTHKGSGNRHEITTSQPAISI